MAPQGSVQQQQADDDVLLKPITPFDRESYHARLSEDNASMVHYFNNLIQELYGLGDSVREYLSSYVIAKQNELIEQVEQGILELQEAEQAQERVRQSMVTFLATVSKAFETLTQLEGDS
ncbi:hypothetical protein SmJEL517_g05912 [Synchytrium microbalum]|uniref:Uncharacterized protein n=1 Tax=Synchytrium microbalum TaxID=1806994 RepID=A0A507BS83_9FUNG|nr:uncharacterized protein SmJEL517_g05912 [Synchytrium microbalum]TPX30532.1 hypothetical protein SmJEL517_g05912 [Synchytrium microbalum]